MKSWSELKFWKSDDYLLICDRLWADEASGRSFFPPRPQHKRVFDLTPPDKVKVVILGQDPYPTKGHANGLAFSVYPHVRPIPGSLRNIFTEYSQDLGYPTPRTGDLSPWAERGVLLLNTILTVEEGKPLSHAGIGWEKLTYEVIRRLSDMSRGIVWILWGRKAQEYAGLIDTKENCIIRSPHPSGLSAHRGFFGSKPFSRTNDYIKACGSMPVDWKLP